MSEVYNNWDIAIAGGGITGALVAHQLCTRFPEQHITLLEETPSLGGAYRSTTTEHWGGGSTCLPIHKYEQLEASFSKALSNAHVHTVEHLDHISGSQKHSLQTTRFHELETWLPVVGRSLKTEWDVLQKGLHSDDDKAFSKQASLPKKGAGAAVLECLAPLCGITDPWGTSATQMKKQVSYFESAFYQADWSSILAEALADFENLTIQTQAQIVHCERDNDLWLLHTSQGLQKTPHLIVAHNPWTALDWLPEPLWPESILNYALKCRPTSRVAISSRLHNAEALPRRAISAAEGACMEVFQDIATWSIPMDYEVSLEAPKAVKSVARVKRGLKKILKHFENVTIVDEHIALQPAAWTFPKLPKEQQLAEKHLKNTSFANISFCGTAYGTVQSIEAVIAQIQKQSGGRDASRRENSSDQHTHTTEATHPASPN